MADVIEITAEVRERELRLSSIPMMPSGSRNHLRIRITFDAEWEGTTKTLVAYRDLSHPYHVPLGMDGTALIPHEVLAEQGLVYLGVFGSAGDQRITSTIVRYGVNEGAITDGLTPSDPTPEMWEQLIAAVNEVRQVAESAMRDAQTAAQGAHRSEQAAAKSATRAEGAATRSETAADTATTSARDAETAKTDAQTAQRAAAQSAADAKTAATRAEQAAGNLSTAVTQAQDAAQAAQQSATQAQGHAKSAGDSAASAAQAQQGASDAESAAQNSAQSAATSAQQAQQSQIAAAGSATGAQASAAEATKQAAASEASAARAENAANEVEQSAQQIAGAIDRLAIHETADGNPAVIRDSADWQMEGLRVYGQSEQVTTTGAQMFDASKRIVGGVINNGIQGSNSRYACSDFIEIPQGTRNLYQSGGSLNQRGFYDADKAFISNPGAVNNATVPDNAKYIRISSDIDKTDMGNIMLCVGNTAKPFEPYTGGKPAPSPEYPQEIASKTVDEIVVTGKNLINQPTLSFTHFTKIDLTNPLGPDTYTFSGVATTAAESDALLISCLDDAGKLVVSVYLLVDGRKHHTVSVSRRVAALQIYAARSNALAIEKNAQLRDLQIELGSVATPYESYHAQTVKLSAPVTLRGVPVKTGGTVTINGQQYVSDVVMETRGLISVKRRTKRIHLTGDELWYTWSTHESGNIGFYMYYNQSVDSEFIRNGGALCSIAVPNSSAFGGGQPGCWVAASPTPDGRYIIISIPQSSLADASTKDAAIQSFKNLLKKLGNVEFLAMLHEPAVEPLPEPDQRAIRALRTYHGNTVVTAGAHSEVDYIADPKLYIDNKVNTLVTAYMQSIPVTIPLSEEVVENGG